MKVLSHVSKLLEWEFTLDALNMDLIRFMLGTSILNVRRVSYTHLKKTLIQAFIE